MVTTRSQDQEIRYAALVLALMGKRVRAVVDDRGEAPGLQVDPTGERIPVPYRSKLVVVGTVVGWERAHYGQAYVDIAGHGRVPVEAVRRARWWHRS